MCCSHLLPGELQQACSQCSTASQSKHVGLSSRQHGQAAWAQRAHTLRVMWDNESGVVLPSGVVSPAAPLGGVPRGSGLLRRMCQR